MNTIPFKTFFFDNALRFAMMICCAAGIALSGHAQLSQKYAHEIVRGINIKYKPYIFDAFYSREEITHNKVGVDNQALLREPEDICSFFNLLDSCEFESFDYANPYDNYSVASMGFNHILYRTTIIGQDNQGYAVIYYNDGRMPDVIWLATHMRMNGGEYLISSSVDDKLRELVQKHRMTPEKIKDTITQWNKMPIDCSGIQGVKIQVLKYARPGACSRQDFLQKIYKLSQTENGLSFEIKSCAMVSKQNIQKIMGILKDMKYKENLAINSNNLDVMGHISSDGTFIWKSQPKNVIGWIIINRKRRKSEFWVGRERTEIIWLTTEGVDRGYFKYHYSPELKALLKSDLDVIID